MQKSTTSSSTMVIINKKGSKKKPSDPVLNPPIRYWNYDYNLPTVFLQKKHFFLRLIVPSIWVKPTKLKVRREPQP
jgi:hypothetical protein